MNSRHFLSCLFFFLFLSATYSQSGPVIQKMAREFKVKIFENSKAQQESFFTEYATEMGLSDDNLFVFTKSIKGVNGLTHNKYKQEYRGIPIFGSTYSLHVKNDLVQKSTGSYYPGISINTSPQISPEQALQSAMIAMEAKEYSWQSNSENSKTPQIELNIIDEGFPSLTGSYVLCYKVELESSIPYDKKQYLIDANSGKVLHSFPLIVEHSIPGIAHTMYYGGKEIIVDSLSSNQYRLFDETRGNNGISTTSAQGNIYTHDNKEWDWSNKGREQAVLDLHWSTAEFYDLMEEYFEWPGLDGNGRSMNGSMIEGSVVNAFWNGTTASFGLGNCDYGPLTTLEVVAHEFTHGLTDETSQLIYANESGAINESMSDIFGKACEMRSDPGGFDWWLGNSFIINEGNVQPFRSFDDPAQFGHPDFYKGALWIDGADVHFNSSVGNHWFWGLVEGEIGVNEIGTPYNISGIGMDTAIQIVWRTQSAYLSENSTYDDYYLYSLLAVEDLYGSGSPLIDILKEAWTAVGLPTGNGGGEIEFDLAISFDTIPATLSSCMVNGSMIIEYTLENIGIDPYLPTMNGQVILTLNGVQEIMNLPDTILPGESKQYSKTVIINNSQNYFLIAFFSLMDDFESNNTDVLSISNSTLEGHDLFGLVFGPFEPLCTGGNIPLTVFIQNNGCPLPAGSEIKILFGENGLNFDSIEITLTEDLTNSGFLFRTIDIENYTGNGSIIYTIISEGDLNLLNDQGNTAINLFQNSIVNEYLNTFDDLSDLNNGLNQITNINTSVVEYEGESYLASSGTQSSVFVLCDNNIFDVIEFSFGNEKTTVFEMCTDLSGLTNIELSFDLMQFKNEDLPEFELYDTILTILKVTYSGTGSGVELFYNQPVEVLIHNEIDLPDNFIGNITFEFINFTGVDINTNQSTYLQYDVNLLDNLEIRGRAVSTTDIDDGKRLNIFPNPVSDILHIQSDSKIQSYRIISTQGKIIRNEKIALGTKQLDISELHSGYFILQTITTGGVQQSTPFVKLNK